MVDNLEYRVEQLEKGNMEMRTDIKLILRNQLPHIQEDIRVLKAELVIFGGLILASVGFLIVQGLTSTN